MRDLPVISVRIISKAGFLPITKSRFTPQDFNDAPSLAMGTSNRPSYGEYSEKYKKLKDSADSTGSVVVGSPEGQ